MPNGQDTRRRSGAARHLTSGRRQPRGDTDSWLLRHVHGPAVIMQKGQFKAVKPLNWPLAVCPRADSNCRHPL
ncbi:hypothetical protein GCM10010211_60630 [Streptomyces albospinus]|uniref:Uncharacterized protein n=1 Tax=Streptomyces albospinus TaxID=285515 RepID=A0ABQ2VK09_9ACTN|nr:hypothetical protein GCM10010211_60630 [Streptomyces albospinus]